MWSTGGHYNDWAAFLTRWGAGDPVDPSSLPTLDREQFTGETWSRMTDRLVIAISARLKVWSAALSRELSDGTDEFTVGRALGHARWSLRSIRALAESPKLPQELRTSLLELVDDQVTKAQTSLEQQLETMRQQGVDARLVEARRRTLYSNRLTVVVSEDAAGAAEQGRAAWYVDPAAPPTRRRVITGE